ncbi:MAG TPA: arylsulfatase, partial [Chloroflexia bacterium]|nr:arylsulfatase [Chloroflexia bacterium]
DGLHALDLEWTGTGVLNTITDMGTEGPFKDLADRQRRLREGGAEYGAPDFSKRGFFRTVVDGQYKLVRWFSPEEYGNPSTLEELYAHSDVGLYDLVNDPGELENLGHPDHPKHDPALVEHMLAKLHRLVEQELGEDQAPFEMDLFGTREVKYRNG